MDRNRLSPFAQASGTGALPKVPTAVVRPVNGLGNRLRAITATQAMALRHGLGFAVHWGPSNGFGDTPLDEILDYDFEVWSRARYEGALAAGMPRVSSWVEDPGAVKAWTLRRTIRKHGFIYDKGFDQPLDHRFTHWRIRALRGRRRDRMAFVRALRPARDLAAEINAFIETHFGAEAPIGVHIRRGDAVIDPDRVGDDWSDEVFVQALRACEPDARFFLATDCEATHEKFRQLFRGRVVSREKEFVPSRYKAPKDGQVDAAMDMFLLSRTARVIGSRGSTFGNLAARIGGIPFVPASEGA